ncbi:MAG TPA: hypothetical protein VFA18_21895, partial [Gemmataceae bacterium]|nr:hypothetical protein [Gemmataceae bacterium]
PSRKPDIEGGLRKEIPALDRTLSAIDMSQIGLAYAECVEGAGPPKNAKELLVNLGNLPKYKKALESGDVVIAWGTDPRRLPADTIIGYQKRAMENGQLIVLLGNSGSPQPQVYTQAQFDAAPKAPGLEGTGKQNGGGTR